MSGDSALRNALFRARDLIGPMLSVFARKPSVLLRKALDIERLLRRDVAQIARGRAGPELALGHAVARRHDGAGRDRGAALDHRAVHDAGLHADEARILERAGVDQRHVADGDMGADARPFLEHARDMHDSAVLDVGVGADADRRDIAAQQQPNRTLPLAAISVSPMITAVCATHASGAMRGSVLWNGRMRPPLTGTAAPARGLSSRRCRA